MSAQLNVEFKRSATAVRGHRKGAHDKVQEDLVIAQAFKAICEEVNTPRSLAAWLCFQYDRKELLKLPTPHMAHDDPSRFAKDYLVTEYLSKYKGHRGLGIDTRKVALEKWTLSESQCRETNARFRACGIRPFSGRVESALFEARRKISSVLGVFRLENVLRECQWGPGSTFDLRRSGASPDQKMSEVISVTAGALPLLKAVIESDPHWCEAIIGQHPAGLVSLLPSRFKVVRGSRLLTVPKTAKTDRVIAAEPTGNSFLQQGVHHYMRKRLRRFGVDLDDQSINQDRSRMAFDTGLSTLDLSAASDSISRELVYFLLPLEWAFYLDKIRSPMTRVDGEWVETEKFASMGNAFCFELETLIFWALSSSVEANLGSVDTVTVYGDDIIVPRESYDQVVEILTTCGFTVNPDKSFKEGNFFESCGKHYFRGVDVTPVYQKEIVNHPSEVIRAHNRIVRWSNRVGLSLKPALKRFCNAYTLKPFPRVPYGAVEDGGFLRPLTEFSVDRNHGFQCHVLDYVPSFAGQHEIACYAYKLRRWQTLNGMPDGHCGRPSEGKWRTRVRWIPESALTG